MLKSSSSEAESHARTLQIHQRSRFWKFVISQTNLTPAQLFDAYEAGRMTRKQLHAALQMQQKVLLQEVTDYRKNPVLAFLDETLNRRVALRWKKQFNEAAVREVLAALGEMHDFPPAVYVWNANHQELPLHCFFRSRREPIFRIIKMDILPRLVEITVEYGKSKKRDSIREQLTLRRDGNEKLVCVERQRLA